MASKVIAKCEKNLIIKCLKDRQVNPFNEYFIDTDVIRFCSSRDWIIEPHLLLEKFKLIFVKNMVQLLFHLV